MRLIERLIAVWCCLFIAALAPADEPPLGSSVRVANGGSQCSGTVFSVGGDHAVAVGAAHCFVGRVGATFDVRIGTEQTATKATLLAIDRDKDLALWKLPASAVKEHAVFPETEPRGPFTGIGFASGSTKPLLKRLKFLQQAWARQETNGNLQLDDTHGTRIVWECRVTEGTHAPGDSGGGVFLDGRLAGVITHGGKDCSTAGCGTVLYCTSFRDVRAFVDQHKDRWADCVGRVELAGKDVPPPPSDQPYNGSGPRPPDLDSDRCMAAAIDKLRKEVAELKKLGELKPERGAPGVTGPPGERGPAGPAGERGERGLSATAAQLTDAVAEWLKTHAAELRGAPGQAGAAGTITVILIGEDGQEISRATKVTAGSTIKLNVKRFQK